MSVTPVVCCNALHPCYMSVMMGVTQGCNDECNALHPYHYTQCNNACNAKILLI
jgi:hypothetical protein